jgi:hypothetical protein
VVFDDFWGDGGSVCRGHNLFLFSHLFLQSRAERGIPIPIAISWVLAQIPAHSDHPMSRSPDHPICPPLPRVPQLGFQGTYTIHPSPSRNWFPITPTLPLWPN